MRKITMMAVSLIIFLCAGQSFALERGAILYHTSEDGKMYGETDILELPCSITDALILREIKSGHAALYIGNERIIHAVGTGVEEADSESFITQGELDRGFEYVGAKVPVDYDTWTEAEKDQLILIARQQVGADYDLQFRHQKGPYDDGFTCVGLVEYVYERVGYDITPGGYYPGTGTGKIYDQDYDCIDAGFQSGTNTFAEEVEFSRIEHPLASGLNIGMIHDDARYIFFPYTQYLQDTTVAVETDVAVSGGSRSEDDSWCFIATAASGSAMHPHVSVFRDFRDWYFRTSVPAAAARHPWPALSPGTGFSRP
jgi:hypothetical protein